MKTLQALLLAAVLAAPLSARAADDEDKFFRHMLTLVQTFTSIAAQSASPERDIADVFSGKNPQANQAASGLLQEITADMSPQARTQFSAIGADLLSIARRGATDRRPELRWRGQGDPGRSVARRNADQTAGGIERLRKERGVAGAHGIEQLLHRREHGLAIRVLRTRRRSDGHQSDGRSREAAEERDESHDFVNMHHGTRPRCLMADRFR